MRRFPRSFVLVASIGALSILTPLAAPAKSSFCAKVSEISKAADALGSNAKTFDPIVKKVQGATSSAPQEIKADWKVLADWLAKMITIQKKMTGLKPTDPQMAKIQAEIKKLGADPKPDKANDHVTAWAKKECGIDLKK